MSSEKHRSRRPAKDHHRKIHPSIKETCLQLRAMGHTYNEIAKKTTLGFGTVEYICTKWADAQPEVVKRARARAMEELAARVNEKAVMALNQITPDSLTHDRIEHFDDSGKLVGVSHSGPTGQQIAVAAGILLDKAKVLEDKAAILRGESPTALSPDSFGALLNSINGRVSRLTQLNANIDLSGITARIVEFENMGTPDKNEDVVYERVYPDDVQTVDGDEEESSQF